MEPEITDLLHTMRSLSTAIAESMPASLVGECCKGASVNYEDFMTKAADLVEHFPKFDQLYQMSNTPSLWSDLFGLECKMLCNKLLLNTNVDIAKRMAAHIAGSSVDAEYAKRMDLLSHAQNLSESALYNSTDGLDLDDFEGLSTKPRTKTPSSDGFAHEPKLERLSTSFVSGTTLLKESLAKNRNSTGSTLEFCNSNVSTIASNSTNGNLTPKDEEPDDDAEAVATLFAVISNLSVYNDRLNPSCPENREYYEKCCRRLLYLSEEDLLNRPDFVKQGRKKVFLYLRQLSRALDMEKSTNNAAIMIFDRYLHDCATAGGGSPDGGGFAAAGALPEGEAKKDCPAFTDNELIKIATACYLLAGALREHWVDINKDKYLEQAIELNYNAFSTKDIIAVQLDVLHRMPKGFTGVHTVMEYGFFFLTNVKYVNHNMDLGANSEADTRTRFFDDCMFLNSAFQYIVDSGALCWLYHCLSKWDDLFVAKNWNRFIPPSRCAAVLVFHFFATFFGVDYQKDLVWCRRFCHRAFKMFYDTDVALWYEVFRENIRSFLVCIEKSSERMQGMSALFEVSARLFRTVEGVINMYHAKLLLGHFRPELLEGAAKEPEPNAAKPPGAEVAKALLGSLNTAKLEDGAKPVAPEPAEPPDSPAAAGDHLHGLYHDTFPTLFSNIIRLMKQP